MSKILFLDFENIYEHHPPPPNYIVFTNNYTAPGVININTFDFKEGIFDSYRELLNLLPNDLIESQISLDVFNVLLYYNFIIPLGKWILTIDQIIKDLRSQDVSFEFMFSSFSKNSKVFVFEAEGESNGQFLYKKTFFLSYYINQYLIINGYGIKKTLKRYNKLGTFYFYLRGFLVLNFKFIQLLFYKFFTLKRSYGEKDLMQSKDKIIVSSRGIIQTQYIYDLYDAIKENLTVLINESSTKPFRNLKIAKKKFENFYYAEGNLLIRDLFVEYYKVIKVYFAKLFGEKSTFKFLGLDINIYDLLPEMAILNFHMKTYALSVIESLNKLKGFRFSKLLSFEMLLPFPVFFRSLNIPVVQIQTTSILREKHPNFVFSDQFYFYSWNDYYNQKKINPDYSQKYNVLPNLKYLNIKRKPPIKSIKILTYFAQPIFLEEEFKIIEFLNDFCKTRGVNFLIKPHPRGVVPTNKNGIQYLNPTALPTDAIFSSDIIVTRNSSIGLDCWMLNVPVVFVVNGLLGYEGISYIPEDYIGTFKGELNEVNFKHVFDNVLNEFYRHSFHNDTLVDKSNLIQEIRRTIY